MESTSILCTAYNGCFLKELFYLQNNSGSAGQHEQDQSRADWVQEQITTLEEWLSTGGTYTSGLRGYTGLMWLINAIVLA